MDAFNVFFNAIAFFIDVDSCRLQDNTRDKNVPVRRLKINLYRIKTSGLCLTLRIECGVGYGLSQ